MAPTLYASGFSMADQQWFAAWSGDFNPVHLDPVASRRELTGDVVVHGVHGLLAVLEWYATQLAARGVGAIAVGRIAGTFQGPIYLGQPLECRIARESSGAVRLDGTIGSRAVLRCSLEWSAASQRVHAVPPGAPAWPATPRAMAWDELAHAQGETPVRLDTAGAASRFPALARMAGLAFIGDLLAVTRIVGMECPGLRSMLAGMDLRAKSGAGSGGMAYRVREADDRISMLRMEVDGFLMEGAVTAFVRPEPKGQTAYTSVRARVPADAFRSQSALVVGGSRGLGEATAKLVAAGGGQVMVTYRVGRQEAQTVCEEVAREGGRCAAIRLDTAAVEEGLDAVAAAGFAPSHVYYFPTPRVTHARNATMDAALFAAFCEVYVSGFSRLYRGARIRWPGLRGFFYPSSVTVDEHPPGLVEYACAKAAGEALCANLNANEPACRILVRRLPVVATDLSQGLIESERADATDVMLPVVRAMHALTAER